MSEEGRAREPTIGVPGQIVRGRTFASLLAGEITVQILWWKPDGWANGGVFPVPTSLVERDARMPNTPVWIEFSERMRDIVSVRRRDEVDD